ncbi:RHS repeat-associated core domain-containing protein [Burkholderia sp. BCC1977]|uniref:RHS repeat-associated core domain-containing protein n=1 Tax=Burkholderia sp. BCC1977 TaxID=2817440 RepID=UPI002ABDCAA0|nr:RHS repeat-associated core domain-containing protein [Burkholderia sp. BCC1977]
MGLLAVKHLDPVVGIDVHSVLVAPSPTPVFLPHPHVGFMLDLREYVEAAKGVVGSIAMALVQEKVGKYLEDHPDVVKKLDDATSFASGKLTDIQDNAIVAEGLKLEQQAAALQSSIGNAIGAGVGMGGAAGRPIFVNGLMRATVGTHSYHVPGLHFPLGESFAPPPEPDPFPSDDAESFMGSRTVLANNDPMSFMALPALSCWAVGMEPPGHNSAHTERTYPSMPSAVMLPIPAGRPVMVGGPPVLNMAAAAKGLFKAFQGSKWAKSLADKLNLKSGFLRCNVLKAEPVDTTTGEVVVQQCDFTVLGRLPLVWDRHYASHDTYVGEIGAGWQTPADIRLELMEYEIGGGVVAHFPDHATAFSAMPADSGWSGRVYDWQHGHALYWSDDRLVLRTRTGLEYEFALPAHRSVLEWHADGTPLILPVGQVADLNDNAWQFDRGPYGNLARLVEWKGKEATGRVIECQAGSLPGAEGRASLLTELTLIDTDGGAHPLVGYEHDRNGNLVAALDAMSQPQRFTYTDGHRMAKHTSARGISFYYSHHRHEDGIWRVDHAWGDDGLFDYRFVFDLGHRETKVIDSLGHVTILQANERGMPVSLVDPLGGLTSYRYDAQGRTCAETDRSGRTTTWAYDAYGNLVGQTLPDGSVTHTAYSAHHKPVCVTASGSRQWHYAWDERGNLLAQTLPSLACARYGYDRFGQLVTHMGPRGAVTRFDYDLDGNLSQVIDALGHCTRYTHDARANVIQSANALGQVSRYEYDRNGNMTRAFEPGQQEMFCSYDADDNLVRYCDPNGQVTQLEYSALGQIVKRLTPDGGVVEYLYDTEEQLVGVVNECGEHYQMRRNALGQVIEEIDYRGQVRMYEYGLNGRPVYSTDPLGQSIAYQTDVLGRIIQKRIPDPRQPDGFRIEVFEYDACGNLVVAENPDCRVEFTYDAAGRVTEEKQGTDFRITNCYDASGNRVKRRTHSTSRGKPEIHEIRYTYDALDSVSSIQIDGNVAITLERDELGRISAERLGSELRREMSYDSSGFLDAQTVLSASGTLFTSEYTYDVNGEMIEKRDSRSGIERFEYDPVGKLTGHLDRVGKLHRFLYDPIGDLLKTRIREGTQTGVFGQGQQTATWICEGEHDSCRYAYDRIGNLVRKKDKQQDLFLHWDAAGLLIETLTVRQCLRTSGESGRMLNECTRYKYDAFHRRVAKFTEIHDETVMITDERRAIVHQFFWDGDNLVSSRIIRGTQIINSLTPENQALANADDHGEILYFYYPKSFRPVALIERAPDRSDPTSCADARFFHNDPNGAPMRITDIRGEIVWDADYQVWGASTSQNGTEQPLRFQGQYRDHETGLHYCRYRYYDPSSGHFITPDPIGLLGGTNVYRYSPNPIAWIDPLGLALHLVQHNYHELPDYDEIAGYLAGMPQQQFDAMNLFKKGNAQAVRNLAAMRLRSTDSGLIISPSIPSVLHGEINTLMSHPNYTDIDYLMSERAPCPNCASDLRYLSQRLGRDITVHHVYPYIRGDHATGQRIITARCAARAGMSAP